MKYEILTTKLHEDNRAFLGKHAITTIKFIGYYCIVTHVSLSQLSLILFAN